MRWIDVFIDVPAEMSGRTASFWADALGWRVGDPWKGHPEFVSLEPDDGDGYLHVQTIVGMPRIHLDIAAETGDSTGTDELSAAGVDGEVARLAQLGGQVDTRHADWTVMASPGGLPFCICRQSGVARPVPTRWPDGHRSGLAQLSIDAPTRLSEAEFAFWTKVTQWQLRSSPTPDFGGHLLRPASGSVQLLLQRLASDEPAVRSHIDLGTDDIDAEVARLVDLGARRIGPGRGWYVLMDPAGLEFCVTGQLP